MPQKIGYGDKFVLICEEAEVCKRLSSNDIKVRRKGVAALKHLLKDIDNRKIVDSTDFSRLWNGIFNFIWMSDKPLVQEQDVESISKLIHVMKKHEMLFVREFFNSLKSQWNRISHYRTDKFLMMIRRFLRQILFLLKNSAWDSPKIESFGQELYLAVQNLPLGLVNHLNDIYVEEIAKVSEGNIPTDALILLLKGYVECIVAMKPSMNVVNHINSNIFSGLTRQLKLHIKQKAVLAAEENEEDIPIGNEVTSEIHGDPAFDPRPGNVDVYLPFIEFDEKKVVEFLQNYNSRTGLPLKVKNVLSQIINMFKSITKLRESFENPKKVMSETYNNTKKRKKKQIHRPKSQKWTVTENVTESAPSVSVNDSQWIISEPKTETDDSSKLALTSSPQKPVSSPKKSPEVSPKSENKRQILTIDSPAWITIPEEEVSSWIPKNCDDADNNSGDEADDDEYEVDYDISDLFTTPPQAKTPKRRRSSRPVVLEVKRSARLANKAAAAKLADDKKVAFTRNNSFQEVREYYSSIRSSPQNPYDASRTPVKGILKPFAVPGPINPFYFPNGQPKLLNLRKQRLSRFL